MKVMVQKQVRETVLASQYRDEMKQSVLGHERIKGFVRNLTVELLKVQGLRTAQGKPIFKAKTIQNTIQDMTKLFLHQFNEYAENRIASDLKKIQSRAELDKQRDLDLTASGTPSGEYGELVKDGVMIGDTRVTDSGGN